MSNSIAPGSSTDVNVKVTALTTNPNVPVTYKTIILKKNLVNGVNTLTQEMMSATNTKYVVKYDYVLGEEIIVPSGCVLKFDGGSIKSNGNYNKITGDFEIVSPITKIFDSIELSGYTKPLHSRWFCHADGTHDDSANLQKLFDSAENIIIDEGVHRLTSGITLSKYVQIYGNSPYSKYGDCALYYDNTSGTAISMNFYDRIPYIKIKGIHLYGKRNPENYYKYYSNTIGINVAPDGPAPNLEVEDCYFENFEYVFNSDHKSYYNSFRRVRANSFDTFCYNFDANNFNVIECRIQYGKTAFSFLYQSGGSGPINIDKCSIEQVESVLVTRQPIQKVNFTNNYVEITDSNIPLSKENCVIIGSIDNVCSIGNELQINSVFRLYYLIVCKCFVSIGNHLNFNLSNTKVNGIYSIPTNTIEVFIAEDNFTEAFETSIHGANYQAFPGTNTNITAPGNAIVQAIDPVSKKRFSWDGKFERSSNRPANVYNGYCYFDKTLNKPIWWNGVKWVKADGTDADA